jgi:hypothetical protein
MRKGLTGSTTTSLLVTVVLVNIMFSTDAISEEEICYVDEQVRPVHAIFHGGDHFVVMEIHLRNQTVYIVDVYGYALDR